MVIKDVFLCMDEMYYIIACTNVTCCIYYSFRNFIAVNFNVSSTKDNTHAKFSRYI
jgi:hypothetical protein